MIWKTNDEGSNNRAFESYKGLFTKEFRIKFYGNGLILHTMGKVIGQGRLMGY